MTTLRAKLLPRIEKLRGIPGAFGLRVYSAVKVRTVTWSGARIGMGTRTASDVSLTVAFGQQPAKVVQMSSQDVVRSGGEYETAMFEVGPVTPAFVGGGFRPSDLDPAISGPTQVYLLLVGPGTSETGDWCEMVSHKLDRPFRYTMTVKKLASSAEP